MRGLGWGMLVTGYGANLEEQRGVGEQAWASLCKNPARCQSQSSPSFCCLRTHLLGQVPQFPGGALGGGHAVCSLAPGARQGAFPTSAFCLCFPSCSRLPCHLCDQFCCSSEHVAHEVTEGLGSYHLTQGTLLTGHL